MTRRVLPELRDRRGGSIVYTVSAAAITGGSGRTAYAVSKGGLLALSRHVAHQFGKDAIRSNVVAPGYVMTEELGAWATRRPSMVPCRLAGKATRSP